MRITPEKVLANLTDADRLMSIDKFLSSDLKEFFKLQTGKDSKFVSKKKLPSYLRRSYPQLLNTLIVIEKYSIWTSRSTLERYCQLHGLGVGNRTKAQLALLLFNNAPEELRMVRIVSVGHKIQTNYAFSAKPSKMKSEIEDKGVLQAISVEIEKRLSSSEKRAKLIEHYNDSDEECYCFHIKHEEDPRRIEEWDANTWVKPVDWIVVDFNSKECYLTVRCKNGNYAQEIARIISRGITGNEDTFTLIDFAKWIGKSDLRNMPNELETSDFSLLEFDIRSITLENVRIRNTPTLNLKGSKLHESLVDLEAKYEFDPLDGSELVGFEIRFKFEYKGVQEQTTVKLRRKKRNIIFSREIPEGAKRLLMNHLENAMGGS